MEGIFDLFSWNELENEVVNLRRQLHRIPELAFQEFKTPEFLKDYLEKLGYTVHPCNKTGLYVDTGENPVIALRADMDGLPIQEETGLSFASEHHGKMHACGHDAHMAMLLGVAKVMRSLEPPVPVRFIFQPSEERAPGGARGMIEEGVLDGIKEIYGLHVDPSLPSGFIFTRPGGFMAASDEMDIWIKGKGGHGSTPEQTIDPVYLSGLFITGIQSIVSRRSSPFQPVVVSICSIHGGTVYNIIPDEVHLKGTVRTLDKKYWKHLPQWILETLKGITATHGGDFAFLYRRGYPVLKNNPEAVDYLKRASKGILQVEIMENPIMGSEDFAYYLEKVPGAFAFLGAGGKYGGLSRLHTSTMTIDESVLIKGVMLFVSIIMNGGFNEGSH